MFILTFFSILFPRNFLSTHIISKGKIAFTWRNNEKKEKNRTLINFEKSENIHKSHLLHFLYLDVGNRVCVCVSMANATTLYLKNGDLLSFCNDVLLPLFLLFDRITFDNNIFTAKARVQIFWMKFLWILMNQLIFDKKNLCELILCLIFQTFLTG